MYTHTRTHTCTHTHAHTRTHTHQGARSLGITVSEFLSALRDAGCDSLPGTAAEVLHDGVRAVLCPDKINTAEWLEVRVCACVVHLYVCMFCAFECVCIQVCAWHTCCAVTRQDQHSGVAGGACVYGLCV